MKKSFLSVVLLAALGSAWGADSVLTSAQTLAPAENFPRFVVPGFETEMSALNAMHRLHYPPVWLDYPHRDPEASLCTLWDEWLTGACLWADTAGILVCDQKVTITQRLKNSFRHKIIDTEGYVATHQHEGIGHTLGWPFPYWIESPGAVGAHFSAAGTASAVLPKGAPLTTSVAAWSLQGAEDRGIDGEGWQLALVAPDAQVTADLGVIDPRVSPFLQLRWSARDLGDAQPWLEWTTEAHPAFSFDRRMAVPRPTGPDGTMTIEMLPLHRHPGWQGKVTRLRLRFGNAAPGAAVTIQALFSQYDTRHNINNFDYIRGAIDVFQWTGDLAFMRTELPRIRHALRFAQTEFQTRENNCVLTTWVGHEGTTGVVRHEGGAKTILHGTGIGNNYWDLLPFGHKDSYATIRYYDTLVRMAELERDVERHPEWNFPGGEGKFDPVDLDRHAAAVKAEGNRIFWSEETGRFVAGPISTENATTMVSRSSTPMRFTTVSRPPTTRGRSWIGSMGSVPLRAIHRPGRISITSGSVHAAPRDATWTTISGAGPNPKAYRSAVRCRTAARCWVGPTWI